MYATTLPVKERGLPSTPLPTNNPSSALLLLLFFHSKTLTYALSSHPPSICGGGPFVPWHEAGRRNLPTWREEWFPLVVSLKREACAEYVHISKTSLRRNCITPQKGHRTHSEGKGTECRVAPEQFFTSTNSTAHDGRGRGQQRPLGSPPPPPLPLSRVKEERGIASPSHALPWHPPPLPPQGPGNK